MSEKYRTKKILMIFFGKYIGGAEMQFIELANYLSDYYKVTLLSLGGDRAIKNINISRKINIKIFAYSNPVQTFIQLFLAFILNVFISYKSIITTSYKSNILGFLLSNINESNTISLQTVSKCMGNKKIDQFILKRYNVLIAGAKDIRDYLIKHNQESDKIKVIHNWVDFSSRLVNDSLLLTKSNLNIETNTQIIGCVGRLHDQKGQKYLIQAYSKIVQKFPKTIILFVGEGASKESLINEVEKLNLTSKVIFTGNLSSKQYNNVFNIIDLYVQPSVFEGLPRTLLDAMWFGKPIIASDINGNSEAIVHNKTGILVKPRNVSELAIAMSYLLESPDEQKKLSSNARKYVIKEFDSTKQLSKIRQILID